MKNLFLLVLVLASTSVFSQEKYLTRNAEIKFESNAEVDDDVRAVNNQVAVILTTDKGQIAFQVLIKGFEFKKALMQEHFNENYMESGKFPKARFQGMIKNYADLDLSDGKEHVVEISGDMEIHGVKNNITEKAKMQKQGENITLSAHFLVPVADYGIKIPEVVSDKVAKKIDVDVQAELEPAK